DMVHYCEGNGNASRENNVYRDDRYASLDVIDDCARYMIDEFNRFFDGKVDVLFNADVSYVTNRGEDMFGLIKDGLIQ
ncbi:hypothetical protein L0O74_13600, partial [Bifidobacterium longum]|nr:hypothetical protein [Bifidobacterium longum]